MRKLWKHKFYTLIFIGLIFLFVGFTIMIVDCFSITGLILWAIGFITCFTTTLIDKEEVALKNHFKKLLMSKDNSTWIDKSIGDIYIK